MPGEGCGKRSSKGSLWGVKKTTPGMIAMAATVVSQRHGDLANVLSEWTGVTFLQLMFVCGPDATFSDRTRGPTNVNWKQHFNQYKQTVLRLPPDLSASLFSWYDLRVFGHIPASGASTTTAHVQGHGDVDELIERLQRQAIVAREYPTHSPASVEPTTAEADPLPVPSIHISGNHTVSYCDYYPITKTMLQLLVRRDNARWKGRSMKSLKSL